MEVPKVLNEAPERQAGDVWRGALLPLPIRESGAMPPENVSKINFEITYFLHFLQTDMVSSAVSASFWLGTIESNWYVSLGLYMDL